MRICGLLKESHIFLELKDGGKKDILREFVLGLKKRGLISNDKIILEALLKRELLGSTGIKKGIAIPHALIDEVKESFIALALMKDGVNFGAVDKMPTYILLLLLGNKKNPGLQLKILAHMCRLVKETEFVERLKKQNSPHEICAILEDEEGKIL